MSLKQAKSKAFKKGRKVGYWLAMQNIKNKKLEVSDVKDVSIQPKPKPELEVSDVKDVSIQPKPKPELEVSDVKDVSVQPKPKTELEIEDQQGVSKKGMSDEVKDFLDTEVPSKAILSTEDLPSTNIESIAIETHDIGIQNDKRNEINLAIEDALNEQEVHPEYYEQDDYYYDNSGPGIKPIIIDPEPEIDSEEIDYAWDVLNEESEIQSEEIDYAWDLLSKEDKDKLRYKKTGVWWKGYSWDFLSKEEKDELRYKKTGVWWKGDNIKIKELSQDEILDKELQRMIEQVKPNDPLPTASEEAELYAMVDN